MLVKELIEKLKELDPNKEIYGLCDDEDVTGNDMFTIGFNIDNIYSEKMDTSRKENFHVEFVPSTKEDAREFYFIGLQSKM